MAIAYVQSKGLGGSPVSVSYTNAITAGDLLICAINAVAANFVAPTSTGETWVDTGVSALYNGSGSKVGLFYVPNCSSHAAGYVVTVSGNVSAQLYEFSGQALSSLLETNNSNANASSGSGSNNETAGAVTTVNADLLFAIFGTLNGPLSAGTNIAWQSPTGDQQGLAEYFIQSAGGSATCDATTGFGSGDAYGALVVAFKPAVSAAPVGIPLISPNSVDEYWLGGDYY